MKVALIGTGLMGSPMAERILAAGHALVSTSANPAGRLPATTALQVRRYFSDREENVDHIVTGPLGSQTKPTTIRDLATGRTIRPA